MAHAFTDRRRAAWLVALLAPAWALSGCATGSTDSAPSTAPPSTTTYSTQSYQQWTPATRVTPRTYSDAEAASLRSSWLDASRPEAAQDQPTPELIAWSDPGDWSRIATCVTEAGFPTSVSSASGGTVADGVASAQSSAYDVAYWTCLGEYTPAPATRDARSEEQLRVEYEYYTTYYLDCMASLGVELDRSSVPSEDVWVSQAQSGTTAQLWVPSDETSWSPQALAAANSGDTRTTIAWTCPPAPPPHALYGA